MKRNRQQLEAHCEHRICAAINRLIQAQTVHEKVQASRWISAWEARLFNMQHPDAAAGITASPPVPAPASL